MNRGGGRRNKDGRLLLLELNRHKLYYGLN
jgi:hypothetical protein